MAKKRRFAGEEIPKAEVEKIAKEVMKPESTKIGRPKKKHLAIPYSVRIPKVAHDRLVQLSEETGLSKSSIIIRGLISEMNKIEKDTSK